MKSTILIIFTQLVTLSGFSQNYTDEEMILKSVNRIFDGMREGDSAKVSKYLYRKATMLSNSTNKEGVPVLKKGSVNKWLVGIASPHDEVWDERISNIKIDLDGQVAQVWMDYEFYLGNEFHHCGSDGFQMIKKYGEWKVLSLLDTRHESCIGDPSSALGLLKMQVKAFNAADIEKMGQNVTDDFVYAYIDANSLIKQSEGRDAFVSDMRGYFENVKEVKSEILNYTVVGNTISFKEEVSWQGENGRLSAESMGVYQVQDGKISRAWYFIQ